MCVCLYAPYSFLDHAENKMHLHHGFFPLEILKYTVSKNQDSLSYKGFFVAFCLCWRCFADLTQPVLPLTKKLQYLFYISSFSYQLQ